MRVGNPAGERPSSAESPLSHLAPRTRKGPAVRTAQKPRPFQHDADRVLGPFRLPLRAQHLRQAVHHYGLQVAQRGTHCLLFGSQPGRPGRWLRPWSPQFPSGWLLYIAADCFLMFVSPIRLFIAIIEIVVQHRYLTGLHLALSRRGPQEE